MTVGGRMYLEAFIWSWVHLHPGYLLRQTAKFLGLAALILLPLFLSNIYLVKQGFTPTAPSFHIEASPDEIPH
ncbi:hypothetical protein [Methylomagnum ishizawai]|nr:hypothetical protein [Methylomagnum ishizawai]